MKNNNCSINKKDAFEKEYCDSLNKLYSENKELEGVRWFLDIVCNWGKNQIHSEVSKKVVLLGTSIPEELVIACGASPCWFIGGSLASAAWSEELVPRDTDPITRSILGFVKSPNGENLTESLFVIPLVSDSMRKAAYELKSQGRNVCVVDVPPDIKDKYAPEKYSKQMMKMCNEISNHMGTKLTKRSLVSSMKQVTMARWVFHRFLEVSRQRTDVITDSARLLVQNSYYMTDSISEWTQRVEALTREIEYAAGSSHPTEQNRPGVMLLGSPVLFPNYKIPFLIRDIGLAIYDTVDSIALKNYVLYNKKAMRGNINKLIGSIAYEWLKYDASSSFVKNDVLHDYAAWIAGKGDIEGVVYHVLKGQIEYDFELERFEAMFEELGIPVFRLETDYQYQDVEQLRIRMEAFCEMLVQNRYREVKKAS